MEEIQFFSLYISTFMKTNYVVGACLYENSCFESSVNPDQLAS